MSEGPTLLWQGGMLVSRDDCDVVPATIDAADSWLVSSGSALALDLHRQRWMGSAPDDVEPSELDAFWAAAIAAIPRDGSWFPRVEVRHQRGLAQLLLRLRTAPELRRSLVLATAEGPDPRTEPWIKGPDLPSMLRLRSSAQARGADDAVLLDPDGAISDGSTSAIAWWEGAELCIPDPEIPRVDSVTSRTLVALALALGITVRGERARPADLDGREIWAMNALHGIRIVTGWVDGPTPAAEPGRLDLWRARLDALRKPLPPGGAGVNLDGFLIWLLDTVQSVDPVLRTLLAGVAMFCETSILIGLIIPGDTIVLVASTAVSSPTQYIALVIAVVVGALAGESVGFAIGRWFGHRIRPSRLGSRIGEANWARAEAYVDRRGGIAVFVSRFLPILHALVPLTVGMSSMRYRRFMAWTAPACLLWALAYVTFGTFAAGSYRQLAQQLHIAGYLFVAAIVLFLLAILVVKKILERLERRHWEALEETSDAEAEQRDAPGPDGSERIPPTI